MQHWLPGLHVWMDMHIFLLTHEAWPSTLLTTLPTALSTTAVFSRPSIQAQTLSGDGQSTGEGPSEKKGSIANLATCVRLRCFVYMSAVYYRVKPGIYIYIYIYIYAPSIWHSHTVYSTFAHPILWHILTLRCSLWQKEDEKAKAMDHKSVLVSYKFPAFTTPKINPIVR